MSAFAGTLDTEPGTPIGQLDAEDGPSALRLFFGVIARGQTYLNLTYIWLAFPLGLTYFVFLITGFSLGLGLAILLWGLLLLAGMLAAVYGLAAFERLMAVHMLGASPPPMRTTAAVDATLWRRFGSMLGNASLWKGLLFLSLKFPLGLASWVISLVSLVVPAAFVAAPLIWASGGTVDLGPWVVEGLAGAVVLSIAGAFGLILALHLNNGLAWLWARAAEALLGGNAPTPPMPPQEQAVPAPQAGS